MGLVDQQKRAMTPGHPSQGFERRDVAVHAVEAFDDDPNAAGPAGGADRLLEGADVVMRYGAAFGAGEAHPLMRAGVDQFVVKNDIAALWQSRQQRLVGRKSRAEKQRAFRPEKPRRLYLQRLMLGMISAQ